MKIKAIEVTPEMKVQAVDGQYRTVSSVIHTADKARIVFADHSAMTVKAADIVRVLDQEEAIREALKALSEIDESMDWSDIVYGIGTAEDILSGLLES